MRRSNERDVPLRAEACFGDRWCFCSDCEAGTVVLLSVELNLSKTGSASYEHELATMKFTWKAQAREEALPIKEVEDVVDDARGSPPRRLIDFNAMLETWQKGLY